MTIDATSTSLPAGTEAAREGWLALSRSAARSLRGAVALEERRELLVVEVAGARYAIAIERVREIVRLATITRVPRTPEWLAGVVALRGEIVEVVDLRRRIGSSRTSWTRSSRIVVIHGEDSGIAGILVDSVIGVLRAPEQDVLAADGRDFRSVVEMVRTPDGFVGVLDLERVVGGCDEDGA
ncbi:MAG: chemotaxis protein CheW [Myxococcota bacterium]